MVLIFILLLSSIDVIYNLPQIRINLAQASKEKLTRTFSASVILNSNFRDKSLRQAANEMDIPVLVYEGEEAFRFNEAPIRFGIQGILRVMHKLGDTACAAGDTACAARLSKK